MRCRYILWVVDNRIIVTIIPITYELYKVFYHLFQIFGIYFYITTFHIKNMEPIVLVLIISILMGLIRHVKSDSENMDIGVFVKNILITIFVGMAVFFALGGIFNFFQIAFSSYFADDLFMTYLEKGNIQK